MDLCCSTAVDVLTLGYQLLALNATVSFKLTIV